MRDQDIPPDFTRNRGNTGRHAISPRHASLWIIQKKQRLAMMTFSHMVKPANSCR
jgi:hypothetical protein